MNKRIIKNDITKNKGITLAITLFVAASAMLVSLAAILGVHLSGALDTLMTQSETTHFMQMHSGELDREKLYRFARQNEAADCKGQERYCRNESPWIYQQRYYGTVRCAWSGSSNHWGFTWYSAGKHSRGGNWGHGDFLIWSILVQIYYKSIVCVSALSIHDGLFRSHWGTAGHKDCRGH